MPKDKTAQNSFSESNLILLLRSYSKQEIRELGKFVHSSFHNNRSDVTLFYEEIKKFHPEFDLPKFTKTDIFSSLYPKKKYNDGVMRKLASNLFKLAEEFGAYSNFKKEKFNSEINLLEFYASKNIDKLFWKQHKKTEVYMEEQPFRDPKYYERLSDLNEIELKYMLKDDPTYKKSSYEKQINNLWKYGLSSMLRVYGFAEYEKFFFNKTFELKFRDELLSMAENSGFMNSKAVEIYYLLLKLYGENKNDEILYKVKYLIEENFSLFTKSECFSFYVHLLNYCNINQLKQGKNYIDIKFEIVKEIVEHELIIHNGVIDPGWFRGIFFMSFEAGKIEFAENFIEKYKSVIAGKDSDHVINHAYASIALHKKDYDSALDYLSNASYQHLNDKWTVKEMYLKIYYETDNYEQFSYVADSIKHLIKDEGSWNENLIQPIRNFVNYSTKLFKIKLGEKSIRLDELKEAILNSKIIRRKWLIEKAEELEKSVANL